ncbi:MAG: helix-turn-helix transcriptional regulator [Deltaproteobacteria bacterium]|nr:helix-turn-helix transcriptional regulator [Deltaproteobacteria bacterium]
MAKKKYRPLGARLKRLREEKGLSLETLANETGLAAGFLLEIENEQRIPPVAALLRISRALGVESGYLLRDEEEEAAAEIKRREEVRKRTEDYSYSMLTLDSADKHLKAFRVMIDAGSHHKGVSYQHEGEEFIYVLKGEVEVSVGENLNHMSEGASLHFNSSVVHKLRNPGDKECELLVVLYTP